MPRNRRRTLASLLAVSALVTAATASSPASAGPSGRSTDAFVQRDGSTLTLQGKPFRFAGTNLYWLGLDENVGGVDRPTYFRIDDALKTARAMNATVVRSHTLGTSLGCPKCLQPEAGQLGPFEALCGFREPARTADLLDALSVPGLEPWAASLRSRPQRDSLGHTLRAALTAPRRLVHAVADALPALAGSPGSWSSAAAAYATVAADFPDDPGLLAALLLNHVSLDAGEALYVAAGVPHAYLRGTGVEIMANSDNVLRGGLTDKHVDTALLSEIIDLTASRPSVLRASPTGARGEAHYASPATEFALSRVEVDTEAVCLTDAGPQVLLCLTGEALLEAGPALAAGAAAFVPAGSPCAVSGAGAVLYRARVPLGSVS